MCMLTYLAPSVQPDVDALYNGATFNDDGHGFAIVHEDRLIVRHGMDSDKMIHKFRKLRAQMPDGPAIFHSRFSTAGRISRRNAHPFHVGGDPQTVVAHNGILPQLVQPEPGDWRSDTRVFAEDLLGGEDLNNDAYMRYLEAWMGKANKIAILTVNPRYGWGVRILNEDSGVWDGDTWYSNEDFRDPYARWSARYNPQTATMYGGNGWESGWESTDTGTGAVVGDTPQEWPPSCEFCGSSRIDEEYGWCLACGTCTACGAQWENCGCFIGAVTVRADVEDVLRERYATRHEANDHEAQPANVAARG